MDMVHIWIKFLLAFPTYLMYMVKFAPGLLALHPSFKPFYSYTEIKKKRKSKIETKHLMVAINDVPSSPDDPFHPGTFE